MAYSKVRLKPGREKSLFYRHPWIFSGGLALQEQKIEDGEIVDVVTHDGKFAARGYFNSKSNIAVRVLTFDENESIDLEFFKRRITKAWHLRHSYIQERKGNMHQVVVGEGKESLRFHPVDGWDTNCYRVVFAESDGLPGLIVDKYDEVLVIQIHTLGMDKLRPFVIDALAATIAPKAIYERSDVEVRKQDGLLDKPEGTAFGFMPPTPLTVVEHGLRYLVDVAWGQKTGFFLDQRENRFALRKYCSEKKVLNLFSYTGGFSCSALAGGASEVTSVDISEDAMQKCSQNVELNGFAGRHTAVTADVFSFLDKTIAAGTKFDVVVVDPPAFVKSLKNLDSALKAYVRLNSMALRVLHDGGILVSSSCSSYVSPEKFRGVLFQSALKNGCSLKVLEQKSQPLDHPVNLFFPEGEYLKFFVLQKN